MPENKFSISNILILIAAFFTLLTFLYPWIYIFWLNSYFFEAWNYPLFLAQIFTSQFLHGSLFHLLSNAIFILYFWNVLEREMWENKYLFFFILSSIFNAFFLLVFSSGNTVGISGFALAVLTYLTLLLWKRGNSEYTWGIVAIAINVFIGLSPWVSFAGHFAGMLFWGLYFIFMRQKKQTPNSEL